MQTMQFNQVKPCRYGLMCYNINDIYVGQSLHNYGEYCEGEADFFRRIVGAGDVVIEAGANIGAHTVLIGKTVGPQGAVLAFEPQRLVFQLLCANAALNSLMSTHCLQVALGAGTGKIVVPVIDPTRPANFGGLNIEGHAQGEEVAVVRLDSYALPRLKLLKVEVEGMAQQVLEGARGLIEKFQPLLYVENDRSDKRDALIRYIDSLGYAMYWHRPALFNPANFARNPMNIFQNIVSFNMFCVPREGYAGVDVGALEKVVPHSGHLSPGR